MTDETDPPDSGGTNSENGGVGSNRDQENSNDTGSDTGEDTHKPMNERPSDPVTEGEGEHGSSGGPASTGKATRDGNSNTGNPDESGGDQRVMESESDASGQRQSTEDDQPPPKGERREDSQHQLGANDFDDDNIDTNQSATQLTDEEIPEDVRKYERFKKMDGARYQRANEFLRDRTYITAREWAIARLCADFRTETGVEMTKIGEHLPELVPFMEDTYSPQAVNEARTSFETKVRMAGATFLYGAMCDFFTASELDDLMYEVTEVAKFLLEVEGVDLTVDEELEAEDQISSVMQEVREASEALRYEECPECGHDLRLE